MFTISVTDLPKYFQIKTDIDVDMEYDKANIKKSSKMKQSHPIQPISVAICPWFSVLNRFIR